MRHRHAIAAVLLSFFPAGTGFAAPPLIQPGAPGEASRVLTAEGSVALSRTGYTPADVTFMQHMIVHHQQAVDMVALIQARSDHAGVADIGRRISLTQAGEMNQMRGWLSARGEPIEDADLKPGHGHGGHGDHAGHGGHGAHHAGRGAMAEPADPDHTPLMHGMLSPAEMDALAAADGSEFDRLFLEGMIQHHQGAIDMVDALLDQTGAGEETALSEFLSHVVADQSAEILRMEVMLSEMGADHSHEGHH
ncbi:MAG: DUF305 domain-containing protein [Oceanicaulis sp.]